MSTAALKRWVKVFFLCLLATWVSAQAWAVAPYSYGIIASNAADADVTAAYNTWKTRRLVANSTGCANSSSVNNGSGNAFSEGIGYGMLMAAYLEADDTQLLKFWNFYWGNRNANNVMNWSVGINNCSNNTANGATDADLDVATALIRASRRWPASANNWSAKATTVLNAMYTYYRDSCNGLKNGDAWGGCSPSTSNDGYNPSYMRTGYLKSFDCFEGGSRWDAVRTRSYNILNYAYNNYALPPDWVHSHAATLGQYGRATNSGGYGYDSCRTPWSLTQDYLWWGNTTALNWANKIAAVFKAQGGGTPAGAAAYVGDDYNYSTGARVSANHQPEFLGGAAVSMLGSAANQSFADAFYTDLKATDKNSYYSDSLKVIYLMILTGIFQEPCNGGGPVGTNTASPTRTPSFTPSPTPTPAFGLSKTASVSSAAVGAPFTYYLDYRNLSSGPDTVGVTPGVSLQFHNSSTGASATRAGTVFQIDNASGTAINLSNYRIRYFLYDAAKTATTDYAFYTYSDGTGVGTGSMMAYPTYTGGPRNANMEFRLGFGSYTLNNAASAQWQGAVGSNSDSWTLTMTDDWSYPGAVGSLSLANAANIVLEQNVAGTWKLASAGAYPGGSASVANVTVTDVLDSRLDYVSAVPTGTWNAGTRTYSYTIASLGSGAAGRITITVQFNGTAVVGNAVPNAATIAASGYPTTTSNTLNVTVAGAANTPTFTATPTRTVTPSPTRTATASPTQTNTVASSSTYSSTATPTRSSTATVTPGNSSTFTATATATPSRTATPSQTALSSATFTSSVTPTRSSTSTVTPGNSSTFTATATATPSRTATATISPSFSATGTITPGSSPTDTVTASITPTFSPTRTVTLGNSPTSTSTATSTASGTPSSTASATATFSGTISPTFTDSSTITPGPSPTHSPTFTVTVSSTQTPANSATRTATPSSTAGNSATATASPSATPSQTPLPSSTRTVTAGNSPTATSTQTPVSTPVPPLPTDTFTAVSTGTSTAVGQDGPNHIDRHACVPSPWDGVSPGFIMAQLAGRADKVSVRFYTKAMVCLGQSEVGAQNAGWCRLPLPAEMIEAPSGAYYYVVQSERDGQKSLGKAVGTLIKLR